MGILFNLFGKETKALSPSESSKSPKRSSRLSHNVYVVELSKKVWSESSKFREANPQYKGMKACLYVGMTSLSPQERFKKHVKGARNKKGYKISSKYVEKYGLFLRPSLYSSFNPLTRQAATQLERNLANSLKKRGYAVWWN